MRKTTLGIILAAMVFLGGCGKVQTNENKLSNSLFSVTMPEELEGLYVTEKNDNSIKFYHKDSKEAGFGGFAFELNANTDPSVYAPIVHTKAGELETKDGTLYDITLIYPSDVQYDIQNENAAESYRKLYESAGKTAESIKGENGAVFTYGKGTKGEELYSEVLEKLKKAVEEGWDASRLEKENFSPMYYVIKTMSKDENPLDKIGYAYYDMNDDGIDELFIGEIAEGNWKGVVYDIYAIADRKPVHIVSGWDRSRYYVIGAGSVANEYSSGANESGIIIYGLEPNETALHPQVGFKTDGYENEENPWFVSYDVENDKWENVSESEWNELKKQFEDYKRFDYTPLSKF